MADKLDPYDVEALESAVNDSATRVSTIWISFLIFSLYMLVAAGTVTQRQLFLDEPMKLPVLNIDLPLWWFFLLAPVLFVIFHLYVLLQVLLLGRTAAAYNSAIVRLGISPEENIALRQRLANTLFAQIFAGSPREREGFIGALLRIMVWITLAAAPILIVVAFQFRFLPYHSHIVTWMHRLLILIEIAAFFLIWPLALDARRDFRWPSVGANLKYLAALPLRPIRPKDQRNNEWLWLRERTAPLTACLLYLVISLSIATFPGEPHVNLFTLRPLMTVQCNRWLQQDFAEVNLRFDRLDVSRIEVIDGATLAAIEKQTSERNLAPGGGQRTKDFRGRNLNCSDLSFADMRRVDLTGARLIGADLTATALNGASLDDAQLQGANLSGSFLQDASASTAGLEGAQLSGAQLQGANLAHARLQGADFYIAELQGADLFGAQLRGASLQKAQLQGANISFANAQGASFDSAQLQLVNFDHAWLQGVDFSNANTDHSSLSNVWTWRAKISSDECMMAHVVNQKPDSVISETRDSRGELQNVEATPEAVTKYIQQSVAAIPDLDQSEFGGGVTREQVATAMHQRLDADGNGNDTEAISKIWSDCQVASNRIAEETFQSEQAALLGNLVCQASENRDSIGRGIIRSWVADPNADASILSVQLAGALLGKECAATKDFDQPTTEKLQAAAAREVPAAAPAK
jgi:uncharacterized protein YjbI with pentapeptide repeats